MSTHPWTLVLKELEKQDIYAFWSYGVFGARGFWEL